MNFAMKSLQRINFCAAIIAVYPVCVVATFAQVESAPAERIALHAAPHEVAPIVMTLLADDPLLAETAPVLIPSDDPSMPPRQNPWQWVEVTGTFTGYISQQQMDESNRPLAGASILAAPDLDSPLLMRADSVADDLRLVGREGPFARVRFQASLPLFIDAEATPLKEDIEATVVLASAAPVASATAVADPEVAARSVPAATVQPLPVVESLVETDFIAPTVPVDPSPVVRILRGRLVSSRDAGIRRAPFQHVIVSPAGRPLAYADLQFFRAAPLSTLIGKDGTFTGAVIHGADGRSALPIMQVRTFRTP
jgi:hypothetical protein